MVPDAYVNHVPVLTGGSGHAELGDFYSKHFIPLMPPDTEMVPVSRTIGEDRLIEEFVFKFTHTIRMDWMLPGLEPTGKPVEVAFIAVVEFRGDKLAFERMDLLGSGDRSGAVKCYQSGPPACGGCGTVRGR